MLGIERPDILVFATPPSLREPLVDLAVRHSVKAIACEKPLATSLAEGRRIVARCAEAGVRGVVCHQLRHGGHWQRLKGAVTAGAIGDIRLIHATGRPSMLRVGTHLVDAVLWLAGDAPVTWVLGQAHGKTALGDDHPAPDHIAGVAELANGVRAFFEIGSLAPHHLPEADYWGDVAVTLVGSLGHASVVLGGGWEVVPTGGRRNGRGPDSGPQEARHLTLLADWLDDSSAVHPANFAASYHGLEVLLGLALSSVERRRVTLPIVDGAGDVLGRLRDVLAETIPRERWRLRVSSRFRVELAECVGCGLTRMTTRAQLTTRHRPTARRANDLAAALEELGLNVSDHVCLVATTFPGGSEPMRTSDEATSLLRRLIERRPRRVYVTDGVFDVPLAADQTAWPEPPAVALVEVRLGALGEVLPEIFDLLNERAEVVVRVELGSLLRLPGRRSAVYRRTRCRVAVIGAARFAILRGWHVRAIAAAPAATPQDGDAFYMHLSWERRLGASLDDMIAGVVDALS